MGKETIRATALLSRTLFAVALAFVMALTACGDSQLDGSEASQSADSLNASTPQTQSLPLSSNAPLTVLPPNSGTARRESTQPARPSTTTENTAASESPDEIPDLGGTVNIATFGDSNTESGYWRAAFQEELNAKSCSYEMIGSRSASWTQRLDKYDLDTDAVGGARMATFLDPNNAIFKHGEQTLLSGDADIVIVVGGTNDVSQLSLNNSEHADRIARSLEAVEQQLIESLDRSPETIFFVTDIVQVRGNESTVNFYNDSLKEVVEKVRASDSRMHHIRIATTEADLGDDNIHFTEEGAAKFGQTIAADVLRKLSGTEVCSS